MMIRFLVLALTVVLVWGVAGCDSEKAPKKVKKVAPKAIPKKAPAVDDLPEDRELPVNDYRYIIDGRRDPFASLLKIREPLNDDAEPETPLQRYGLKELKLIATVLGQQEPRAMIVAPDKKAYTLTVGVKVGRNRGKVVEITVDKVVVEERFVDFSGALRTELKEIALPQGEGE
jgi:type IV pilus assembly protein PilP